MYVYNVTEYHSDAYSLYMLSCVVIMFIDALLQSCALCQYLGGKCAAIMASGTEEL